MWNTLPHEIKASATLHAFVCRLKKYYDNSVQPNRSHLYGSDIKFVAIHCLLRMGRSPLHISRSYRKCECDKTENVNHFLLDCPLYEKLRITMLDKLQSILTNSNVKLSLDVYTRNRYVLNLLLKGSVKLNADENVNVFAEIKKFLRLCNRF